MRFNFFSTVAAVWPCCCCCCTAADYQRNAPWKNTTRNNSRDYSPSSPRPSCSPDPSVKIGEARVNYPDTVFIRLLSKETPQPVEPIRVFFFSSTKWQPCCRQPGSPAAVCERGGDGGSLRSLLVPAPHTGELARAVLGWRSWLVAVTGGQPCGLNSKGSCHRNAQVSPQACVAHLTQ